MGGNGLGRVDLAKVAFHHSPDECARARREWSLMGTAEPGDRYRVAPAWAVLGAGALAIVALLLGFLLLATQAESLGSVVGSVVTLVAAGVAFAGVVAAYSRRQTQLAEARLVAAHLRDIGAYLQSRHDWGNEDFEGSVRALLREGVLIRDSLYASGDAEAADRLDSALNAVATTVPSLWDIKWDTKGWE